MTKINARSAMQAAAIAIVVLLGIAPAQAQKPGRDAVASRATDRPAVERQTPTATPILDGCKQTARGLKGPKRATFMTNCLKTKKSN